MTLNMRLGDLLVESGLITEEQLNQALQIQKTSGGKKLGNILLDLEIITEDQLYTALEKRLNTPYLHLEKMTVPMEVLECMPEELARKKNVFPCKLVRDTLYVATDDPLDYTTLAQISASIGKNVEPYIATRSDIAMALERYYRAHSIGTMANEVNTAASEQNADIFGDLALEEVESRVDSVAVVKFINNLIVQAYHRRASDIHFEILEDYLRIRFRIDGDLTDVVHLNTNTHAGFITRLKIMANMDIAEKRIPLDGRFDLEIDGGSVSVRAASMPTVYGEKMVLRLMPDPKSGLMSLEQLGCGGENARLIRSAIHVPNGLVLVTGPTGSGKSTTMYSLLNEISTVSTNIITVEDPVEKIIPGVNQTQVNNKAGLTFAAGLRAILRQDPDKIMIGEIRDTETADIAARAAITGHLVLASMHTNDAVSAYMRLMDMGVEPYVVISSVVGIIAQRLVKVICPHCAQEQPIREEDIRFFEHLGKPVPEKLFKGVGCAKCDFSGFYGRTAIMEVVLTDNEIRKMVARKARPHEVTEYLTSVKGQQYLTDDGYRLVAAGKITLAELVNLSHSVS